MDQKEYSELLDRFFQGLTSREENEALVNMDDVRMESMFEEYSRNKWESRPSEIPDEAKKRMKAELLKRINIQERKKAFRVFKWAAVAAGICIAAFAGYQIALYTAPVQTFEVFADKGQKTSVTLPDGTCVTLNSSSSLSYTSGYNDRDRTVCLSGEAYFDVAKNKELPFVVKAGEMEVTALGTEFDVKSYEEDNRIVATLVEGSILTSVAGMEEVLKPNQYLIFNKATGTVMKRTATNPEYLVPWKNNEILLEGQNLKEVSVILERMYNVDVMFRDEDIMEYSYTGLIKNNSLNNVLELISSTSPIGYELDENALVFFRR